MFHERTLSKTFENFTHIRFELVVIIRQFYARQYISARAFGNCPVFHSTETHHEIQTINRYIQLRLVKAYKTANSEY